jgi:type I restriction-modification system DNA methylase subunit
MPRVKKEQASTSPATQKDVKIETCLLYLRNLCRTHGLQIWNKQSLSDQIYQDLLFIWHIPRLVSNGLLTLDVEHIGSGKMTEVSYKGLLSLKEEKLIAGAFKELWRSLQYSEVSKFFEGRDFAMFSIEKNEKKANKYFKLLKEIIQYFASIEIASYGSNAAYTYFKKDLNKGTAQTFGQFYTPPSVLSSVVNEVNPKAGEKTLDPSSGSCSFIQEAATKLMKKDGLSVEEAFENLYGVEIEPNIYQEGAMNIFLNFGILPNTEENIREDDSLIVLLQEEQKFDKILANPPFGADATSFFGMYFKDETVKKGKRDVITKVVNPDVKVQIPFTNTKESAILFFQLIVQKLVDGGKAGVVMSSTILNDGNKDMMKWFLESCSLEKIIVNPAGTFKDQGTSIETFSFIFTKGAPTTKVNIVMLGAEDEVVRSLTLDQIKEAGWKLQLKEEEKKVEYTGVYELKKLGDLLKDHPVRNPVSTTNAVAGNYLLFSSSKDSYSHNVAEFSEGEYLLQGSRGTISGATHYCLTPFSASNNVFVLTSVDKDITSLKFIYYWLRLTQIAQKTSEVAVIPMLTKTMFNGIDINLPPLPIQQEIVASLDRIFADPHDMKDCLAFTDKAMDLMMKDPSGKLLEDIMGGLRLKRSHLLAAASTKAQMAAVMRSVGARGFEKKKLGDVCDLLSGKTNNNRGEGNIPFYDSNGQIAVVKEYLYDGEFVITARVLSIGSVNYVSGKFWAGDNTINIRVKEAGLLSIRFFYNWLNSNTHFLKDLSSGIKPYIRKSDLSEILIPIPPLPIQQEVLTILNEMEAELKVMEQMAAKAEQRAKYILDGYLTS